MGAPTGSQAMALLPVVKFDTRNRLEWRTKERIEWNIYFAESQPAKNQTQTRLAVVQPFKDDGWTLFDCMCADMAQLETLIKASRTLSDTETAADKALKGKSAKDMQNLQYARGKTSNQKDDPSDDPDAVTKEQITEYLSLRVKYTPSEKPDVPVSLAGSSSAGNLSAGASGGEGLSTSQSAATIPTQKDILKKGSGTIELVKLAGDTEVVAIPVPEGLIIPEVDAKSTNFKDAAHIDGLTKSIQDGIAEAGTQMAISSKYMEAANRSVDIFKQLAMNLFKADENLLPWQKNWRKAKRVITLLRVDKCKVFLANYVKEKGFDAEMCAAYLGEDRPDTMAFLQAGEVQPFSLA